MFKRPQELDALFALSVGDEIFISPPLGETVSAAFQRLKRRTKKYGKSDRYYRLKTEPTGVLIQRVSQLGSRKLGDWYQMPIGTRLLLKSKPTDRDVRKAKVTADHLSTTWRGDIRKGYWLAGLDEMGRLVAERYLDEHLNNVAHRLDSRAPVINLWAGEWP